MHVIHVHAIQVKQFSVKLFYLHRFTWTVKFSGSVRFYYYIKGEAYTTSMCASNMLLNMWHNMKMKSQYQDILFIHVMVTHMQYHKLELEDIIFQEKTSDHNESL